MPEHPYITTWDTIATLDITVQEKAILWCLGRHGDWDTRSNVWVSHERIAKETGLSKRQVRFWLAILRCTPADAATLGGCHGGEKCYHRGLLTMVDPPAGTRPAVYQLALGAFAFQPRLPDVAPRRAFARQADQYDHLIHRA